MITVKRKIQLHLTPRSRRDSQPSSPPVAPGCIPRISRLMALAIRMEQLLLSGEVNDLAELARLGHVTQPRISQLLNLTLLAPDIQEELLFLPRITSGKATIHEKLLRPITAKIDWFTQRQMWEKLKSRF